MNEFAYRDLLVPAVVLALSTIAAGGVVYYSDTLRTEAQRQLAQQATQLQEARTRLQKSGDEKEIIVRHLGGYLELQRIGFAGEEQRVNWLDGLRLANERVDLFGVEYQISAQAPYAHADELKPGEIALNQSAMTVRLRLLHEGDLLRFFDLLQDTGAGIFAIDECALKRIDASGALRYQPNLAAECRLSWITAKPRRMENQP